MYKILMVDDSATVTAINKEALESQGYEVITASDGEEGFKRAKLESPDLILLDVMLPKLDGYMICRMLKYDEKYKNIPIIMLTAKASDQDRQTGKEVGADDFVVKGASIEDLISIVKKHLK